MNPRPTPTIPFFCENPRRPKHERATRRRVELIAPPRAAPFAAAIRERHRPSEGPNPHHRCATFEALASCVARTIGVAGSGLLFAAKGRAESRRLLLLLSSLPPRPSDCAPHLQRHARSTGASRAAARACAQGLRARALFCAPPRARTEAGSLGKTVEAELPLDLPQRIRTSPASRPAIAPRRRAPLTPPFDRRHTLSPLPKNKRSTEAEAAPPSGARRATRPRARARVTPPPPHQLQQRHLFERRNKPPRRGLAG